jgi:hypothetical protein
MLVFIPGYIARLAQAEGTPGFMPKQEFYRSSPKDRFGRSTKGPSR